jgi:hypothetical protein
VPLNEPKPRRPLHRRQITIDAFERADGLTEIEATLVDTKPFDFRLGTERPNVLAGEAIHRISVRVAVAEDKTIRECEVAMDETPYGYCREVEARFDLTGLKLTNGFMKAVAERIGPADNCWHAREMLPQIATVLVQATYPALRDRIEQLPPRERPVPPTLNTCAGWQSHRAHVRIEHAHHVQAAPEGEPGIRR